MERKVILNGIYRHFKGNLYKVIAVATDTETMKEHVVYVDGSDPQKTWSRPIEMFLSEVDKEKYPDVTQKYRFELLTNIKLNRAENDLVDLMLERVKNNDGYCPCYLVHDDDHKCMCKEFREMEVGTCHCGLYRKDPIIAIE